MAGQEKFLLRKPKLIYSIVKSITKNHQLVTLYPEDSDSTGLSFISGIQGDREWLLIHSVHDKSIHQKISAGVRFTIQTAIEGVDIRIPGLVASDVVGDVEEPHYKVRMPTELYCYQRRRGDRTQVPGAAGIKTTLRVPRDGKEDLVFDDCDVYNISAEGCAISMTDSCGRVVASIDQSISLIFAVETWTTDLEVKAVQRHHRYLQRTMQWQVGFQFVNPPEDVKDQFDRLVAGLRMINHQQVISA